MRITIDMNVRAPKLQQILQEQVIDMLEEFGLDYSLDVDLDYNPNQVSQVFVQTGQTVIGGQSNTAVIQTNGGDYVGRDKSVTTVIQQSSTTRR